jgi:Na+/H+ antiporter NhaD/arsenite permease-like protein
MGIMLGMGVVTETGVFPDVARWMDETIHNVWILGVVSGFLSAVVDTFTIAISDISLYPVVEAARLEQAADAAYLSQFTRNGSYWMIVAYTTAVGGCLLSVGSVSGLALMKMEHLRLGWYLRNLTLKVLAGWVVGLVVLWLEIYYV